MASRSPRRPRSGPSSPARRGGRAAEGGKAGTSAGGPPAFEEVAARAARLNVTVERVLEEYARIAFADLRHIIEWKDGKLRVKDAASLSDADAAAISEIVSAGDDGGKVRVKLYDKKAALDAIARHLGMFPLAPRRRDDDGAADDGEDAREALQRYLARLAAGGQAE